MESTGMYISRKNNGDNLEICIRKFIFPYVSPAVWGSSPRDVSFEYFLEVT